MAAIGWTAVRPLSGLDHRKPILNARVKTHEIVVSADH